jgi:hypothetical protein
MLCSNLKTLMKTILGAFPIRADNAFIGKQAIPLTKNA